MTQIKTGHIFLAAYVWKQYEDSVEYKWKTVEALYKDMLWLFYNVIFLYIPIREGI